MKTYFQATFQNRENPECVIRRTVTKVTSKSAHTAYGEILKLKEWKRVEVA